MELRKTSGLLACASVLALALLSGCGSSSNNTTIPATTSIFNAHTILFRNHTTLTMGYNAFGQLGIGNLDNQTAATIVPGLPRMTGGSAGGDHTLAFSSFNNLSSVYAWGSNYHGQIGIQATSGTSAFSSTPVKLSLHPAVTGLVTGVAAGGFHSLALMDGFVYSWGYNGYGQLGDRENVARTFSDSILPARVVVVPNGSAPLGHIVQVAAGGAFSLALTDDGKVFAWGDNANGQLGTDPVNINNVTPTVPTLVPGLPFGNATSVVTGIAAGGSTGYAVTSKGKLYAWGFNNKGQAGQPLDKVAVFPPTQISFPNVSTASGKQPRLIKKVSAGLNHALALDTLNNVSAWGLNEFGQLGDGGIADRFKPVQIGAAQFQSNIVGTGTVDDIMAFGNSSLALVGSIWYGWGDNGFGQLGQPASNTTVTKIFVPTRVRDF